MRRSLGRGLLLAIAFVELLPSSLGQNSNACDQPEEVPDLLIEQITDVRRFGTVGDITGYGIGSTACSLGTCWVESFGNTNRHPVVGQNLFRLHDGRFEQIGQSWVKHIAGFLQETYCSRDCLAAPDFDHLGLSCSDTYAASINGRSDIMGPKSEVNAATGFFPFPPTGWGQGGNAIFRRVQVHNTDLDPALNAAAKYYTEIQYVAPDEAAVGTNENNFSYRSAHVAGSNGVFSVILDGPTVVGQPALQAWAVLDSSVHQTLVSVPNDGKLLVAVKTTLLGDGFWRFEYAVQNLTQSQGVRSFSVPIPAGATIRNAGFHDVDYHSGETQEGVDWRFSINATSVVWAASSLPQSGSTPNYLKWGTLYNFRFEADAGPGFHDVTFGLPAIGGGVSGVAPEGSSAFPDAGLPADETGYPVPKPGEVIETLLSPDLCNGDGVCSGTETCAGCAADCTHGSECCGNGTCGPGESNGNCHRDCSSVLASSLTPSRCDSNGICGPGESCSSCPSDCAPQAGRCCGNGTCEPGETDSNCFADCGIASPTETRCGDGVDEDRDGTTDCLDPDCCTDPVCDAFDLDGDSRGTCDCNDGDNLSWSTPGEALNLVVSRDSMGAAALVWNSPTDPGGSRTEYDALRSSNPADFVTDTDCLTSPGPTYLTASDDEIPVSGGVFYYLSRARNGCPGGPGTLGVGSDGVPRVGRSCP